MLRILSILSIFSIGVEYAFLGENNDDRGSDGHHKGKDHGHDHDHDHNGKDHDDGCINPMNLLPNINNQPVFGILTVP